MTTVHVFRCGSADLYGLTQDQTGANLPSDECRQGWRFMKTVDLEAASSPRGMDIGWQDRDGAVRAGIANNGFFISEAGALPIEFQQDAP